MPTAIRCPALAGNSMANRCPRAAAAATCCWRTRTRSWWLAWPKSNMRVSTAATLLPLVSTFTLHFPMPPPPALPFLCSGVYRCTASNENGEVSAEATIKVERSQSPPRLAIEPSNLVAITGTTIELPCQAEQPEDGLQASRNFPRPIWPLVNLSPPLLPL